MTEEQIEKSRWLNRLHYISNEIKSLNEVKQNNKHLRAVSYETDGSQHVSGASNSEENRMIKILELDEKIDEEINHLIQTRIEIFEVISKVDDAEMKAVLIDRYLNYKKFEDIAKNMGYDERTVKRKHKKALDKVVIDCHPTFML